MEDYTKNPSLSKFARVHNNTQLALELVVTLLGETSLIARHRLSREITHIQNYLSLEISESANFLLGESMRERERVRESMREIEFRIDLLPLLLSTTY